MASLPRAGAKQRVLILGGGFGGAYAAQKLSRSLPRNWDLTIVDRNNFLLFYPLLVEAGVGSLEARHVVVPIRKFLKRGDFIMAEVKSVDLRQNSASIHIEGGDERRLHYDHLVIAIGSVTRLPPVPGLRDNGFQFKSLADGIDLRDRGIRLLELASTVESIEERKAILRIVVVGANFTGTEFAGEYQDFLRDASKAYRDIDPNWIEVILVEYADRILTVLEPELAEYAHRHLVKRGLKILTKTTVNEVHLDHAILSTGVRVDTRTVVWCAGIAPNPMLPSIEGLPLNSQGYIACGSDGRVSDHHNVWAVGDLATIHDPNGKPYPATAQHATREGTAVARNILRVIDGAPTEPFVYSDIGSLAALGCRTAVAKVFGIRVAGFPAWFLYRTIYLFKMPSWSRRIRIMMDWTTDLFFRAEQVQLGARRIIRPGEKPNDG